MICTKKQFNRKVDEEVLKRVSELERDRQINDRFNDLERWYDTRFEGMQRDISRLMRELRELKKAPLSNPDSGEGTVTERIYYPVGEPGTAVCDDCKVEF